MFRTSAKSSLTPFNPFNPQEVTLPKKKVVLKLERAQAATFQEWLGPPTIRGLKVAPIL